jgi:methylene-tetrahydromethanopterin dehydrogenase
MADPSGAYTTAAAMVASVEAAVLKQRARGLKGLRVVVLGGTGPVGRIAGVLAAQAADVALSSRNGIDVAEEAAQQPARASA